MTQNITKLLIYMYIERVLTYINSSQKTFLGGVLALAKLVQMVDLWYGRAPYGKMVHCHSEALNSSGLSQPLVRYLQPQRVSS